MVHHYLYREEEEEEEEEQEKEEERMMRRTITTCLGPHPQTQMCHQWVELGMCPDQDQTPALNIHMKLTSHRVPSQHVYVHVCVCVCVCVYVCVCVCVCVRAQFAIPLQGAHHHLVSPVKTAHLRTKLYHKLPVSVCTIHDIDRRVCTRINSIMPHTPFPTSHHWLLSECQ